MTRIVPRDEWCPVRPRGTPARIAARQEQLWLHHGATGTSTVATAVAYARHHIERNGWIDVGYSWLIAAGQVLEGRGPGRAGAHTSGRNKTSYGTVVCGDYSRTGPSVRDLDALDWLLRHGHDQGWWPRPALTGGHRDVGTTACPGDALYRQIPTINAVAAQSDQEDDMPKLSEDAQEFYQQMYDQLRQRDARPSSLPNVLDWVRQIRDIFTR